MQAGVESNYNQILVPSRAGVIHFKFEFEDEPRKMTPDEFWEFCSQNRKLNAELTQEGEVIIMPPPGFETSDKNVEIVMQLAIWAKKTKTGKVTDSNGGFVLPNGAVYAPDASWTSNERLARFTPDELKKFLPLTPDFVLELRSESDSLKTLQAKMVEYIENGARLAWLINPHDKQVEIYRPKSEVEVLENPVKVSGENILEGFELDLIEIW